LLTEFQDKCLFLTIYIAEAHPQDKWPLGQHVSVIDHKTIEDRIGTAKRFISDNKWRLPTVVDSMKNDFMNVFKCHPERFYTIIDGKLGMKGEPIEAYYLVSHIKDWLSKYFESKKQ